MKINLWSATKFQIPKNWFFFFLQVPAKSIWISILAVNPSQEGMWKAWQWEERDEQSLREDPLC